MITSASCGTTSHAIFSTTSRDACEMASRSAASPPSACAVAGGVAGGGGGRLRGGLAPRRRRRRRRRRDHGGAGRDIAPVVVGGGRAGHPERLRGRRAGRGPGRSRSRSEGPGRRRRAARGGGRGRRWRPDPRALHAGGRERSGTHGAGAQRVPGRRQRRRNRPARGAGRLQAGHRGGRVRGGRRVRRSRQVRPGGRVRRGLRVRRGHARVRERQRLGRHPLDELAHAGEQGLAVEGLGDVAIGARGTGPRLVERLEGSGEQEHRHLAELRVGLQRLAELVAVHAGHDGVGEHDVGPGLPRPGERVLAVVHGGDPVVLPGEDDAHDLLDGDRVVGEQQVLGHCFLGQVLPES